VDDIQFITILLFITIIPDLQPISRGWISILLLIIGCIRLLFY